MIPKIVIFVFTSTIVSVLAEEYCFDTDTVKPQLTQFSTHTAYPRIRGELDPYVPGCKPTNFWYLSRHGIRGPVPTEIDDIPGIQALQAQIIQNWETATNKDNLLCEADIELLKAWILDDSIIPLDDAGLSPQGAIDTTETGKRFKNSFMELLTLPPSKYFIDIQSTNSSRTKDTLKAWAEGVWGQLGIALLDIPEPSAANQDLLLMPLGSCPKALEAYGSMGSVIQEFQATPIFQNYLQEVSTRLGFNQTLTAKQVSNMLSVCRIEAALNLNKPSAWCVAFRPDHFSINSYSDALMYYRIFGYGRPGNEYLMCKAVQDLYQKFTDPFAKHISTYFSHDVAMLNLMVALGIAKDDEQLTPYNYEAMLNRKWKIEVLTPMGTNLAIVKYDCGRFGDKVAFYLNERRLATDLIPWCPDGVCPIQNLWNQVQNLRNVDCETSYCQ